MKMNRKITLALVFLVLLALLTSYCNTIKDTDEVSFSKAQAIWPEGQQYEKNLSIGFRAEFEKPGKGEAILRITGSSLYRIYLNNDFIGHGPARAGHGYYRVDEWDLSEHMIKGNNILAVEVAGYNVNSFYLLDQPSFIQAEVISRKKVIAATSAEKDDFVVIQLSERVQKVPRYSFQRPFVEYYKLTPEFNEWRVSSPLTRGETGGQQGRLKALGLRLEDVGPKRLVPRRIPYPEFLIRRPVALLGNGTMETGIKREQYWRDRAVVNIGEKLGGFPEDELELNPAIELQEMENLEFITDSTSFKSGEQIKLTDGQFQILDLGTNLTGFIGTKLQVHKPTRLYICFDEILQNDDVNFKRLGTIAAITYDLKPGTRDLKPETWNLESIEPYTFRYMKIIVAEGDCTVEDVYLREYANPDIYQASFTSSDDRLDRIFFAGLETFRQNAVDIFMDCPHRERAGWLCDSYFTARVAQDVSGNSLIEKNFFENFCLPDTFAFLPEGMLPMCYPADHNDGVFIPNWAMWFVVQLQEYLQRSQDRELVDALKPKVMALLDYFEPFKNEDGLLEKLESWIFVEWSAANGFVQDVSYPTNMLYAATLDIAGKLYGKKELILEAETIRKIILEQSFNGEFFVDNAKRSPKKELVITENTSEVCQYFAFYFGLATPQSHPELWRKLSMEFGPARKDTKAYPTVHPANSFVGNYLRLELLSRYNLRSQLLDESIEFFDYMARETGTLWENISPAASCNHGFASHIVHVLYRDVLGISKVDVQNKEISFQFSELELEHCEGQMPIGDETISLSWQRDENTLTYQYEIPEGYYLIIKNISKLKLIENN